MEEHRETVADFNMVEAGGSAQSVGRNHRTTEWLRPEGATGGLVQPHCSSRVTYSTLLRIVSRWLFNISREEGDPTTSLGNLFQCSVTPTVKKFFLLFRWNFVF